MQSITLKSHVGSDGLLSVHLPDLKDTDVERVFVYQSVTPSEVEQPLVNTAHGTPLDQFDGCIQDESFVRHPQPQQPDRETLK